MSEIVNTHQPIEQTLDGPLTKPKKPRTAKQLEAFKKVQEKRQQNIKEKNEQKLIEGAKLMLQQQEKSKQTVPPTPPSTPQQPKRKHEILSEYTEVDQSDSEEDVVIVKKSKSKPKPKKKVTRVIIESDSDSDSGNDGDDEDENYEQRSSLQSNDFDCQPRIWRQNINYGEFFC